MFPVRCITCGKCLANLKSSYDELLENKKSIGEALDILKIKRYCCRRMFLGYVNIIDVRLKYAQASQLLQTSQTSQPLQNLSCTSPDNKNKSR